MWNYDHPVLVIKWNNNAIRRTDDVARTQAGHNPRRVVEFLASVPAQTPISRSDSQACPNIFQSSRNYGNSAHLARLMNFRFLIHSVKFPDSALLLMHVYATALDPCELGVLTVHTGLAPSGPTCYDQNEAPGGKMGQVTTCNKRYSMKTLRIQDLH